MGGHGGARVLLSRTVGVEEEGEMMDLSPHPGLGYLAACLRERGAEVRVLDPNARGLDLDGFQREAERFRPDVVGLTAYTVELDAARRMLERVKASDPGVLTVLGGPHASALPEETLGAVPALDVAVVGEGERAMVELAEHALGGRRLGTVAGIAYRREGRAARTRVRAPLWDLDSLPFPAWDLFPLDAYRGHRFSDYFYPSGGGGLELPVATMRGCPHRCIFCYRSGDAVRYRRPEEVVRELSFLSDRYGARRVYFTDGTFGLPPERARTLCRLMVREGLHERLRWSANVRVDGVGGGLLEDMLAAGCDYLAFGVESGSDRMLGLMRKGYTVAQVREALRAARRARAGHGLRLHGSFVLGLPYETQGSLRETLRLARELGLDQESFSLAVAYPGTELFEMAMREEGGSFLRHKDWTRYSKQGGGTVGLGRLSYRRLKLFQMLCYAQAYMRPDRALRIARLLGPRRLLALLGRSARRMAASD